MASTRISALVLACITFSQLFSTVSFTRIDVSYDLTAVGSGGELFVASSVAPGVGDESYAVSRGVLTVDESTGRQKLTEKGLVPLRTQVNGATSLDPVTKKHTAILIDNPIRGQVIPWLSVYGNQPVVVFGTTVDTAHSVAVIADTLEGRTVLQNTSAVRDAVGVATQTIKAAVGAVHNKHGYVLAAVTPSDSPLFQGQDEAGIAVLHATPTGLVPIDASGARSSARAARLSADIIQIGGIGSIDGVTAMYWDHHLNRLFVGLDLDGGGVAVVVGELRASRVKTSQGGTSVYDASLTLSPIIHGANGVNEDADWDGNDYVVADENDGRAIQQLNVMHASTGTSYVVVSRDEGLDGHNVYALPLINQVSATSGEDTLGHLATTSDFAVPATQGSDTQLYTHGSTQAQVGAGSAPDGITSMHVVGDSVFISCAGGTESNQGVFVSQALFDTAGKVASWSTWQCVSGAARPTYGFGFDAQARSWYLTGADSDTRNTMHVATWGLGEKNELWGGTTADASVGLVSKINSFFEPNQGGVEAVHMFSAANLSPSWHDGVGQLSNSMMLAALGRNKCALALTMQSGVRAAGSDFDAATHFRTFDLADDGLALGVLSCAAVTRDGSGALNKSGRLLVGGPQGLAVLSQTDGDGFTDLDDLSDLADYRFKELKKADGSSFTNVRQIQSDADTVYVLTDTTLYKFLYSSNKFKDASDPLEEEAIATTTTVLGSANHSLLSFIVLNEHAVLGTTSGLWTMTDTTLSNVADQMGTGGWQQVMVTPGSTDPFGVCAHLHFVPGQAHSRGGMLYVLNADMALNVAIVYRVALPSSDLPTDIAAESVGAVVHTIDGTARTYQTLLGQLREYFYTTGAFAIDVGSAHHTFSALGNGAVRVLPVTRSIGNVDQWVYSSAPALEVSSPTHTIGRVVQDPATGTLVVPGIWGIRVLQ